MKYDPDIHCEMMKFVLSVATLYVSAQKVQVVDDGKRQWVDTHWFRGNSYFRIGWDWVKAALLNGPKVSQSARCQ